MRREELVMELLGGLDDSFIEEAMPRGKGAETSAKLRRAALETAGAADVTPGSRRRFIISRALTAAAAVTLVILAGTFLWQNWDNIALGMGGSRKDIPDVRSNDAVSEYIRSSTDGAVLAGFTDADMPEPFYDEGAQTYNAFAYPWKSRFLEIPLELAESRGDEAGDWYSLHTEGDKDRAPCTLTDSFNLYSFICDMDIPWSKAEKWIKERNELYRGWESDSGDSYEERIFTEEELNALRSDDRAEITRLLASEYSIVTGEYAFSPKWLYYHTAEDYRAAGISPETLRRMIKRYESLGLDDEAWRAFRKKLVLYAASDVYGGNEALRSYTVETDRTEPFSDHAFDIFESVFYGEWELADRSGELPPTLSFTYSSDPFNCTETRLNRGVIGIFETDEIYALPFSNYGVGACYFIEKSDPYVMYLSEYMSFSVGIDVVKLYKRSQTRFIGRKPQTAELKEGRIGALGLRKLMNNFGSDLKETVDAALTRDFTEGFESLDGSGKFWLPNSYNVGDPAWYLAEMSEDGIVLGVPYVRSHDMFEQPFEYMELRAVRKDGEWEITHAAPSGALAGFLAEEEAEREKELAAQETISFSLAEYGEGFGAGAMEIYEKAFFGEWEPIGQSYDGNITLTYEQDMFTFENFIAVRCVAEYGDIYVLPYLNGGVGECYVIKKSEPDILYKGWWNAAEYGPTLYKDDTFIISKDKNRYRRINDFGSDREIKKGARIGVLGLYRLIGGSGQSLVFSTFCEQTGFRAGAGFDGTGGFTYENGERYVLGTTKALPITEMYYLDGDGERSITLSVRYYSKRKYDVYIAHFGDSGYEPDGEYFALDIRLDAKDPMLCDITYRRISDEPEEYSISEADEERLSIAREVIERASVCYRALYLQNGLAREELTAGQIKAMGLYPSRMYYRVTDERYDTWEKYSKAMSDCFSDYAREYIENSGTTNYFERDGAVFASHADGGFICADKIKATDVDVSDENTFTVRFRYYILNDDENVRGTYRSFKDCVTVFVRKDGNWVIDSWYSDLYSNLSDIWHLFCCGDIRYQD